MVTFCIVFTLDGLKWYRCKTKIKSMKGVRRDMLPGYLDEFMWRERAGADKFNEIALQYPVNR